MIAWFYIVIASCFEVCWIYSLKSLDMKAIGRIKLATMGFDERVRNSDTLRSAPITHGPSPGSNDHPKVSVKAWEVHLDDTWHSAASGYLPID